LDKLESIFGFRVDYNVDEFIQKIEKINVCLIGQTAELAPADKKIYALRDVTATIQSIPLIAASIMSKKIAEGIDALVLDVKTGVGAFMTDYEQARRLTKILIRIGGDAGKKTVAYITDMNNPLGNTVGNWLEIVECIDCLQGNGPDDLMEITHQLSGTMIFLGKMADSIEAGIKISKNMIQNGTAWDKFVQIVREQEGDIGIIHNPESYPQSKYKSDYHSPMSGWVESINAYEVGMTAVQLGAGRQKNNDPVDYKAGIRFYKKAGQKVEEGSLLFTIFTDNENIIETATERLSRSIIIIPQPTPPPKLILNFIDEANF